MIIHLKRNMRIIQIKKDRAMILSRCRCLISDILTTGLEVRKIDDRTGSGEKNIDN